ncbi:MAG: hypothetical protein J0M15_04825 [Deltaproteobacteria bacterium]|jgi:hypothetical protein|nr:hypothetical protein [Deltaproteobacteria bacterium]
MKIVISIVFFLASMNVYAIGDCAAKVKLWAEVQVLSGKGPANEHFIPDGRLTTISRTANPDVVSVVVQSKYGGRQTAILYVLMAKNNYCEILGLITPKF